MRKAIDREALIETAFFGLSTPAIGAIAPAFGFAYLPPDEAPPSPQAYNLEEAKALAESAGIVGATPTIMVYEDDQRSAEVLRNQLADIGLDVQIEKLQQAAWNERWMAGDFECISKLQQCRRRSRRRPLELLHPGRPLELLQLQEPGGQRPVGRDTHSW